MIIVFSYIGAANAGTYKIAMNPWIASSIINVADVKGFWKNRGIDVIVINLSNEQEKINALIYKRVEIAVGMIGLWVDAGMEGMPLTIIAETDWSDGGDKIIVKKDMNLNELKGNTIGVYWNAAPVIFFLNKYLEDKSLKLSDVKTVGIEPSGLTDNFIAGRFRMIVSYDPMALDAEREGNGKVEATTASYPGCMPEGFAVRTDVLKDIPKQDLAGILEGLIEAGKWIRDEANWGEYKTILNTKTFESDPPYSDGDLRLMLDSVRIHDAGMLWERNKTGGGLSAWLRELKTMLKENSMLKKDFRPEDIFDNEIIMQVLVKLGES
jgi:NitT/TauT family transport system substrate-binding protein